MHRDSDNTQLGLKNLMVLDFDDTKTHIKQPPCKSPAHGRTLQSPYSLGTRTELWSGHGCSSHCILLDTNGSKSLIKSRKTSYESHIDSLLQTLYLYSSSKKTGVNLL